MLTRGFDLSNITGITNDLGSKLSAFTGKVSSVKNISNIKDVQKLLAGSAGKASNNTMNNETAEILSKVCDGNGFNKTNSDYIRNLERALGIKNGVTLCSDAQMSELDRLLSMSTMMNASRKTEYKGMINKMVGSELGELGYSGSIPSCLYGKVESLIDSLLSGVNGNINLKLDLMKLFSNKCLNDSLSAVSNSSLGTKVGSLFTDSMLQSGDKESVSNYLATKYKTNPIGAMNILGNSLSSQGNSDNASTKMMMYSILDNSNGGLNSTVINKGNIASNLNGDKTINKNSTGLISSLSSVFNNDDSSYFSGKSNLGNIANSYLSNTKSKDSLGSTTKSSVMNLASTIKLANLFG